MLPTTRFVPHDEDGSATAWTGEKKRKTIRSSSEVMDIQLQEMQGGMPGVEDDLQEDTGSVFSARDQISTEEVNSLWKKLQSREKHSFQKMSDEEGCKINERIDKLRLMEYRSKISNLGGEDTAPGEVDLDWVDRRVPSQTFDWTIFRGHLADFDLDIYQRIVPKRECKNEYWNFGEYCNTFSSYEIDDEYIKYWGEMTKKIMWIKEYMHLEDNELREIDNRGARQAVKIAADFSHLPSSLAIRGFEMSFKDAFDQLLSHNLLLPCKRCGSVDLAFQQDIEIFRKKIPENASEEDVKDSFAFMVDNKYHVEGRKLYLHYAKKKLEIARRLHLTGVAPDDETGVHCLVKEQEVEVESA
ncbi:hypothetical protein EJB05_48244 [Eragrostis curvula]|uniref:Uncharacterized protein n=1 Tax=Eragrostis curvula TaxID=38414 RepID=A0A5J9T185_9POAL|nr:hypothetical protein EJB05_48244 [Eragrostis curvula]